MFCLAIGSMSEAGLVLGGQVDVVVLCEAFECFFPEILAIHFVCSRREDQEVDDEWCDGWNKCVQEARSRHHGSCELWQHCFCYNMVDERSSL